ncbi:MAG: hypothetical protein LBF22_08885, partial [Deltaproteobacteria bacterium]|nr:hypothetical protein [Deltaproteobacteria bacterium]
KNFQNNRTLDRLRLPRLAFSTMICERSSRGTFIIKNLKLAKKTRVNCQKKPNKKPQKKIMNCKKPNKLADLEIKKSE